MLSLFRHGAMNENQILFELGKTLTENYEILRTVYFNRALSRNSICKWLKLLKTGMRICSTIQGASLLQPLEMLTQLQVSVKWWQGSSVDSQKMADELNMNKETSLQILYGDLRKRRSALSSSHRDSRVSRSNGDSHHSKASSRIIKTTPSFLVTFFSFLRWKMPSKERGSRMLKMLRKMRRSKWEPLPRRHLLTFQNLFRRYEECNKVWRR